MEQAGKVWIVDLADRKTRGANRFSTSTATSPARATKRACSASPSRRISRNTGRYYVDFTDNDQHTRIVRFTSKDRLTTDPSTAEVLLQYKQPFRKSQRRLDRLRPRRHALHRQWRRRRGQRSERQRPVARHPSGKNPAHRCVAGNRLSNSPGQSVCRPHRTPSPRSGPTASAIRGAARSTAKPATSGSATSARTNGRRSISCRAAREPERTTAGGCARDSSRHLKKRPAARRRPAPSNRFTFTNTAADRPRACP